MNYFAISLRFVLSRTVHEQRMEENNVPLLHFEVHSLSLDFLVLFDPKVGFVHLSIPVGVDVIVEGTSVSLRQDVQRSVLLGRIFEGSPRSHDSVGRTEREVSQILVERMSRASSHSWGLVDEHGVD